MSVTIPLKIGKVRFRGDYDWMKLYKKMKNFMDDQGYEVFESKYKQKEKILGDELEVIFDALHDNNDYARNHIKIYVKMWNYHEKEKIVDGKKKTIAHGRLLIEFSGRLELDYDERWEATLLQRKLRDFYHKFIIKHEIEDVWADKLYYEILKLQGTAKKVLGMESESDVYDDMW